MSPVADTLSLTFAALSDPTRRAMLARLLKGEATVNELAAPFKMSLPAISKHIKVLEKAGLLIKTRQAQQRPCKINGGQITQALEWLEQYRQRWEGGLDQLNASQPADTTGKAKPHAEKRAMSGKGPEKPKRTAGNPSPATEKAEDNVPQQQTGFDF